MKQGDENELQRKLRLEEMVTSNHLRLAMEMEKRTRLENDAATKTAQFGDGDGRRKKSKTGENGSYETAQVGPEDRGRRRAKNRFDLIWI